MIKEGSMSTTINSSSLNAVNPAFEPHIHRAHAVAAALEVIATRVNGADATSLAREFTNLSTYADQIQAALKVK
jgi:hypothetical protein